MNGAPGEPCTGFPTGVENKGGSSKFNGEGGGGLQMLLKNTCEGVFLLLKLPAISLQTCKSTKNELLHTFFARF